MSTHAHCQHTVLLSDVPVTFCCVCHPERLEDYRIIHQ